jgi:signal peptidase I
VADPSTRLTATAVESTRSANSRGRHRATGSTGRRRRLRRAGGAVVLAVPVLITASVAGLLPLQIAVVEAGSMSPTLEQGQLVLMNRTDSDVARRDVVVAESPLDGSLLVKRAVALGGDTVGIEDGVLVVNGEPVCEPGVDPALIDGMFFGPVTVPADSVFLLGDHRDGSIDSRNFGAVPLSSIVGEVEGRVFPPGSVPTETC